MSYIYIHIAVLRSPLPCLSEERNLALAAFLVHMVFEPILRTATGHTAVQRYSCHVILERMLDIFRSSRRIEARDKLHVQNYYYTTVPVSATNTNKLNVTAI
jgi:hypothetical protein